MIALFPSPTEDATRTSLRQIPIGSEYLRHRSRFSEDLALGRLLALNVPPSVLEEPVGSFLTELVSGQTETQLERIVVSETDSDEVVSYRFRSENRLRFNKREDLIRAIQIADAIDHKPAIASLLALCDDPTAVLDTVRSQRRYRPMILERASPGE